MIDKNYLTKRITQLELLIVDAAKANQYADAFGYSCMKRILQDIMKDAE